MVKTELYVGFMNQRWDYAYIDLPDEYDTMDEDEIGKAAIDRFYNCNKMLDVSFVGLYHYDIVENDGE